MPQPTYAQAVAERDQAIAARDRAVAERNEALEERGFLLQVLDDLGLALRRGRELGLHATDAGVEVCELYSRADALAAATRIRDLIAMVAPPAMP